MEYRDVYERISNINVLDTILEKICDEYGIGKHIEHKIIQTGYEDFNISILTTKGKYFIKILNKERTDKECQRLAKIYYTARKNNINVPQIYKIKNNYILKIKIKNEIIRVLLMEYIDGINMYESGRNLTLEEIGEVAYQAANIDKINFQVEPYYDEWTLTNFKLEYEKKIGLICEEDKEIVTKYYKKFLKLNLSSFPKSYIHADIMNANLIKSKDKIWIIDFSALNYLPRIIELVVIVYGICNGNNREETIEKINYFLTMYNKENKISKVELENFDVILNAMGAMSIMQASFIKANGNNFKENQYWLDVGKKVIDLNLKKEEIKILRRF